MRSTDLLMLAGSEVMAHPDEAAAGVAACATPGLAAISRVPLQHAAELAADTGDPALLMQLQKFRRPHVAGDD